MTTSSLPKRQPIHRILRAVSGICFLGLSLTISLAQEPKSPKQESPEAMAQKLGVPLPRLPWHLVDLWWEWEGKTPHFESLEVDVSIDRDIPSDYNLYIAPIGIGRINGMDFYGGLQTNINGWATKESRTRVHPGKGAIFSRWSSDKKTPIGLGHVKMEENGLCESAGYEGEFCSIRRPFAWSRGTYTYQMRKGASETIDGKESTWWDVSILDQNTKQVTKVGSLRFEGKDFEFWNRHAAFVEIYSTEKIPKSDIPKVEVTFGYPRINGKKPPLKSALAQYNLKGRAASPQCATAKADGEKIKVEVGPLFKRENSRDTLTLQP